MLVQLRIQNIALIDQMELSFGKGLHVLTGETGAGKSIVVDAVSLLLGGRADRELIRSGCDKACAEGLFDLHDCPAAFEWLKAQELDCDEGTLILSREINQNGRSLCRVQGAAMPLSALREVSSLLLDLHGQHAYQSLLDERTHLSCLDALGDEAYQASLMETGRTFAVYQQAYAVYMKVKRDNAHREERVALLREQEKELSEAQLEEGEESALAQERDRYRSMEKITQALRTACDALYEGAGGLAAVEQARAAMRALSTIASLGEDYGELARRAESLYYDTEDLGLTVRAQLDATNDDPQRAAYVEERLDLLRKLSRKYGAGTQEMLQYLNAVQEELARYENLDGELNALRQKAQEAYRVYFAAATELSKQRRKLGKIFEKRMEEQLNALNMAGTRFYADFSEERASPGAHGMDSMRFLIAPNAGEEKKPLSKIASGGEISRVMLALKALSAQHSAIPSMVFDEIDTGISGRTAQVVAQKMGDIARYRQVICVTHLQQIAAMADRHYFVHKFEEDGRTKTAVEELKGEERVNEIARMISGVKEYSESGRAHARNMLNEAEQYRQEHTV